MGALFIAPGEDVGIDGTKACLGRVDLLLDPIHACHQLGCQCQVDVAGGIRGAEFHAGGIRLGGILGDAHRCAAVAQGEEGIHRGFISRDQSAIRIGARVGQGQQGWSVGEQPADIIQRRLAQAAIPGGS